MSILTVLAEYLPFFIIVLILIGGAIATFINEKRSVQSWLLLAVSEAEKALGGGVGALKLRNVFQQFVELYPRLAKYITFETFSKWVDSALEQMKEMLKNNKKADEYINGEKGDE